jgi:general stress protein 26
MTASCRQPDVRAFAAVGVPWTFDLHQRRSGLEGLVITGCISVRMGKIAMQDETRRKILTLLDQHRIMTVATLRPDGWPQATTVGYVNVGLSLYFLCGLDSQKARNLAQDDRVSLTVDHDTPDLMAITGLSMAGHARPVTDRTEAEKVLQMLPLKYPDSVALSMPMPNPDEIRLFHVTPTVISVLDYTKGFGHTDLVTC